jgi:hypothetical protein
VVEALGSTKASRASTNDENINVTVKRDWVSRLCLRWTTRKPQRLRIPSGRPKKGNEENNLHVGHGGGCEFGRSRNVRLGFGSRSAYAIKTTEEKTGARSIVYVVKEGEGRKSPSRLLW